VLAFLVLLVARPGSGVAAMLWPSGVLLGALSSALLVPVAITLGGPGIGAFGVLVMVILCVVGLLFVAGALPIPVALPAALAGALLLAAWIVLVNGKDTVSPRAARLGRRCGVVALAGTATVAAALVLLPNMSTTQLALMGIGGVPAVVAWLAVPAWSLRVGRMLAVIYAEPRDELR